MTEKTSKKFPLDHQWDSLGMEQSQAFAYACDDHNSIHSSQEEASKAIMSCYGIPLHGMHILGYVGGKFTKMFGDRTIAVQLGETDLDRAICIDDKFTVEFGEPKACSIERAGLLIGDLFEVEVTVWKLMRPETGLAFVAIRGSAKIRPPGDCKIRQERVG